MIYRRQRRLVLIFMLRECYVESNLINPNLQVMIATASKQLELAHSLENLRESNTTVSSCYLVKWRLRKHLLILYFNVVSKCQGTTSACWPRSCGSLPTEKHHLLWETFIGKSQKVITILAQRFGLNHSTSGNYNYLAPWPIVLDAETKIFRLIWEMIQLQSQDRTWSKSRRI